MKNKQLANIIEQLALKIVLIDNTDIYEMEELITFFRQIKEWGDNFQEILLVSATSECIKILTKIINKSTPSPEESFSIISRTVSEIQLHARNEFVFSCMSLPLELGLTQSQTQKNNLQGQEKSTESYQTNNTRPVNIDSNNSIRHPDTLPGHLANNLFAEFLSLQNDNLDKIEALILSIEEKNDETSIIELKRMIHTIKGESGFLNLNEIEIICHLIEDILEDESPSIHADIFLNAIDWIKKTFLWYMGSENEPGSSVSIIESIKNCSNPHNCDVTTKQKKAVKVKTDEEINSDVIVLSNEISEKLSKNTSKLTNDTDLYYKFISRVKDSIDSSNRHIKKLLSNIEKLKTNELQPTIIVQQCVLKLQYYITKISAVADFLSLNEIKLLTFYTHKLLDKMLVDTHYCNPGFVELISESFTALKLHNRYLEVSLADNSKIQYHEGLPCLLAKIKASLSGIKKPKEPEEIQHNEPKTKVEKSTAPVKELINVDSERLDRIIDMIGELVIAESMIIQAEEIKKIESQELSRHISQMNKITRDLQETGLSLRMLPIKSTFQKMARVARDTAKKSGKNVKFIMQGENTELDKTVVDKIGEPLLHMIRNAIDHGIESNSNERIKNNKNEFGTIIIRAFHKGGNIHIEIEDDGQGLNKENIIEKAIEKNLINKGEILKDFQIYNMIFEPGFSTAKEITDLSGRGFGMNVVKSSIEALRGHVEIKSEQGKGSIFTIKIPLTLAIIDGMVIRSNKERYIIPTLSIVTSNILNKNEVTSIFKKGKMVNIHGQLIPFFSLSHLFETISETENSDHTLIVIIEENGKKAAISVDELLGKQQIVIKSLGESMKNIPGISGGAIMPDGRVGLILDVAGLIRLAHNKANFIHEPHFSDLP